MSDEVEDRMLFEHKLFTINNNAEMNPGIFPYTEYCSDIIMNLSTFLLSFYVQNR